MKMKRWKVWVSFVFGIPHKVQFNQFDKTKTDYQCRFVQRLPGDVVLSREEAVEMKAIIMALVSRSDFPEHYDRALALLRGRR